MPAVVKSILNPLSLEAVAARLGPWAFFRELLIALILSLSLPLVWVIGTVVLHQTSSSNLLGVTVGVIVAMALIAIPLTFYASLRLNAATLARERAVMGAENVRVHAAFQGPFLLKRSFLPGSTRSRILSGFPSCIGFGLVFALMSYATSGSPWTILHLLLGAAIAVQAIVIVSLFAADS